MIFQRDILSTARSQLSRTAPYYTMLAPLDEPHRRVSPSPLAPRPSRAGMFECFYIGSICPEADAMKSAHVLLVGVLAAACGSGVGVEGRIGVSAPVMKLE